MNAFVQECVSGITLIKLYMREEENLERFKVESRENFNANMEQVFAFATFRPVIEFISVFAVALILWYGGLSVLRLELTLGALLAYLAYIRILSACLTFDSLCAIMSVDLPAAPFLTTL